MMETLAMARKVMGLVTRATCQTGRTLVQGLWEKVFAISLYSCAPVTKQAEEKNKKKRDDRMYCHFKIEQISDYFLVSEKQCILFD